MEASDPGRGRDRVREIGRNGYSVHGGGSLTQSVAACSHSRFVRLVLREAGSFVRFKVFEHQAHVLRVEDVGPSAIAQRVELAAQALGRWAAAPGVP